MCSPAERPFDVIVVGELNVDIILSGEVTPAFGQVEQLVQDAALVLGGSSVIFACGAARLGLRVAFVGKVGDDLYGRFVIAELERRGIDVRGIIIDPNVKTGVGVILSRGVDRAILTYLGAIAELSVADVDPLLLAQGRHLHVGGFFLLDGLRPGFRQLCTMARANQLTVSLDTNYDPREEWNVGDALTCVDIFLPNQTEALAITRCDTVDGALERLISTQLRVVVKLGADGAVTLTEGQIVQMPSIPVAVVDTTGAGDSFDAGFIYGYLAGWSLEHSLALAAVCGALSTRAVGGTAAQPTLAEAMNRFDVIQNTTI